MDHEERSAAARKLRALDKKDGTVINDEYSHGMKKDVAAVRKRPYACDFCEESYRMATQLSDHLRSAHDKIIHASLLTPKLFQCQECGMGYEKADKLQEHMKNMHDLTVDLELITSKLKVLP